MNEQTTACALENRCFFFILFFFLFCGCGSRALLVHQVRCKRPQSSRAKKRSFCRSAWPSTARKTHVALLLPPQRGRENTGPLTAGTTASESSEAGNANCVRRSISRRTVLSGRIARLQPMSQLRTSGAWARLPQRVIESCPTHGFVQAATRRPSQKQVTRRLF